MENQSFTCPNPSCGKVFANPLKTENVASRDLKAYNACPYCLTEIVIGTSPVFVEELEHKSRSTEIREDAIQRAPNEPPQPAPQLRGCPHHFGYLSKRSPKEKIPDDCMMCEQIVQCMLKAVTG
jgi:hypothetical protein